MPFFASSISKLGLVERSHPSLLQHRNALQQYIFLLTWLSSTAQQCMVLEEKDVATLRGSPPASWASWRHPGRGLL